MLIYDDLTMLTVWIVSRQSGRFPDGSESFMLQKRFLHFWRIYVTKTIYALLAHMGQIPHDGDFGQNVVFFLKKVELLCD